MAMSRDEIYSKVQAVLVDALGVDEEEVTPNAVIKDDLGAESIDFLDIMFRLEQSFSVKLPKGEIEREARRGLSDDEFAVNGILQPKGLERIRSSMPEIDPAAFRPGLSVRDIPGLYTVQTFVNLVEAELAKKSGATAVPAGVPSAAVISAMTSDPSRKAAN